jgi:hypothetical protein
MNQERQHRFLDLPIGVFHSFITLLLPSIRKGKVSLFMTTFELARVLLVPRLSRDPQIPLSKTSP